ncbi:MAG TPA: RsmE family RNA methyltransferase, partial [Vicinamibacterales bacterium]|nr:RsmE family RNA methyltransferase [Vicinamibacterales bacterium]
ALPKDEAHHVTRVLRLPPGATVRIFDGKGREWSGRLETGPKRGESGVIVEEEAKPVPEPEVRVTLAIGVLKGDQMDAVVRDATALGVVAIAPMETAHVTVPPRAWQSGAAVERWQRVSVAAAKQCGRAVVPTVRPVATLADVLIERADTIWLCAEPALPEGPTINVERRGSSALVLVGPEGGWAEQEVQLALRAGAGVFNLGPRTLRAELAPTVALSSLWTKWGW